MSSRGFAPLALRLDTARLVLAPLERDDAPWMAELLNTRGTERFTREDALERIARQRALTVEQGIGVRALRGRDDGRPLGYCGLVVGRASVEEPELAYELLVDARGRGYATEAGGAVLDAAFATGRGRVWATVGAWNAASFRVLDKLGFRRHHVTQDATGEVVWSVRDA